jgi:hypothetical protein
MAVSKVTSAIARKLSMTRIAAEITPPPWAGALDRIKRHGATFTNCDSEPVQSPAASRRTARCWCYGAVTSPSFRRL